MEFAVGQRVKLSQEGLWYIPYNSESNRRGSVIRVEPPLRVIVQWDDGEATTCHEGELEVIDEVQ